MSWSLSKPNVSLRVTKFAPKSAPVPAGLSPEAREAHRANREAECAKVEPATDLYEVRKPYNIWLYGSFVELEQIGPLPVGPLLPEHRCNSFDCLDCQNKGVQYADYLKAKAVRERNGF
jgi:hypothetical protein